MDWPFARPRRLAAAVLVAAVAVTLSATAAPGHARAAPGVASPSAPTALAERGWMQPVLPFRIVRPFVAPAHDYGPGHRGIDLEVTDGAQISAPAAGIVAFAGMVAGRGVLTIDHGGGLVSTFEPVQSELVPGTAVERGVRVGTRSVGGHVPAGQLHFGVRLDGAYINPMLLLGEVPRAILLPCCG